MGHTKRNAAVLGISHEVRFAKTRWRDRWSPDVEASLRTMLAAGLRVSRGELVLLDGALYINHSGLLALADRNHCAGIYTKVLPELSYPELRNWVVEATVFKSATARRGFVGLGDADPSNISPWLRGSELRVAETRAVNRALRKAYAVGLCSAEEIGSYKESRLARLKVPALKTPMVASSDNAVPKALCSVQDRLKLILRDHQLDPVQVLRYACRFLKVGDVREASPAQLASFVTHLEQFSVASGAWLRAELNRPDVGDDKNQKERKRAA